MHGALKGSKTHLQCSAVEVQWHTILTNSENIYQFTTKQHALIFPPA